MNKKFLMVVLSVALALTACFGISACKIDEPPDEPDDPKDSVNVYGGEGDFEFAKWQADSSTVYTEITENDDGSTFLRYIKSGSADSYSAIYSKVSGLTDKFGYLNVTVSGSEGKTLLMRIGDSTYSSLLLGTDKIVCVSGEAQTFSWEINASNKWMLGRVEEISLIAEPGQNGSTNVGTMTVYKSWLSETLPKGAFVAKASEWVNGGNYKIAQVGDVTQVGYVGISPNTWQNIYLPVHKHDASTQNTANMTLTNTGSSTLYLSVKTVAADNPDESSSLTWDNVVLEAGGSKTLQINLAKNIRSIVMFVCSADNVPAGIYTGSFTISEVTYTYTDPADVCVWQATSMFTLEKGAGKGTFTYTALKNGDWNQNVITTVQHDFSAHNAVSVTVTNCGTAAAHYFVKAEGNGTQINGDAFALEAGESKNVVLQLAGQVTAMVVWVNADAYEGSEADTTAGVFELTNPVFSHEDFFVAADWTASSGLTVQKGDGFNTVSYTNLANGAWDQNVITVLDHDVTTHNAIRLTITNTGATSAHYFVKSEGGSEQIAGDAFDLAAGESKTVVLNVPSKVEKIVIWVNADSQPAGVTGPSDGSFTVTDPVFSHEDFFVAADWSASSGFTVQKGDGLNTVSYTNLADGAWDQNIITALNHDATVHNAIRLTITNTGATAAHYFVKAEGGSEQIAGEAFDLAAGENKEVVLNVPSKVEKIVIWVNADAQPAGVTGPSDGSFTVTDPAYDYVRANPWSGSSVYRMTVAEDDSVSVIFEGVQSNTWQNIFRTVSCDYNLFNTMNMTFTNTGAGTLYLYIANKLNDFDKTGTSVVLEAGETKTVSIDLPCSIDKTVLFICSDSTIPEGTYSGSFTFTQPEFTWKDTVTAGGAYSATRDADKITVTYTDLTANWGSFVNASVRHNGTDDTVRFTVTNTGTEAVHLYLKLVNESNEEVKSIVFDLGAGESREVCLTEISRHISILQIYINTDSVPAGVENPSSGSIEITNPVFTSSGQTGA